MLSLVITPASGCRHAADIFRHLRAPFRCLRYLRHAADGFRRQAADVDMMFFFADDALRCCRSGAMPRRRVAMLLRVTRAEQVNTCRRQRYDILRRARCRPRSRWLDAFQCRKVALQGR